MSKSLFYLLFYDGIRWLARFSIYWRRRSFNFNNSSFVFVGAHHYNVDACIAHRVRCWQDIIDFPSRFRIALATSNCVDYIQFVWSVFRLQHTFDRKKIDFCVLRVRMCFFTKTIYIERNSNASTELVSMRECWHKTNKWTVAHFIQNH